MSTLWKVTYKTYPEPGARHDKTDVFIANGVAYPGNVRSHYNFGRGKRRFAEEDVVRCEQLWSRGDGDLPRELVEAHPDAEWLEWAKIDAWPSTVDDGTPIEEVISSV